MHMSVIEHFRARTKKVRNSQCWKCWSEVWCKTRIRGVRRTHESILAFDIGTHAYSVLQHFVKYVIDKFGSWLFHHWNASNMSVFVLSKNTLLTQWLLHVKNIS